jgi:hypothetical protein
MDCSGYVRNATSILLLGIFSLQRIPTLRSDEASSAALQFTGSVFACD